jgi:hypothetical protein
MISVKCPPWRRTAAELCPLIFLLSNLWIFPAPAGPPAAAAVQADFPLTLNTRWTYHLHQKMGPGVHFGEEMAKLAKGDSLDVAVITEVVGSDVINGENYVRLESRLNGAPYGTEWHRQTASGLLLGKRFSAEEGQEILMVPPQKLLSSTLKAGESWDWKGQLGAPVVIHIRVVGPADVKVPAGTFHTTRLNYDFTIESEGRVFMARQARWFAPGVGFVKNDVETLMGGHLLTHIVLTLEKYEPGPGGKSVGGH